MLVNISHDTRAEHRRLLYAGIGFMTAAAVLIAFSIAIYQKAFTPVTTVTVRADRAGLQLPKYGDVRIHGVIVGQIRSVTEAGGKAVIKLGLQPPNPGESEPQYRKRVLNSLVEDRLRFHEIDRYGFEQVPVYLTIELGIPSFHDFVLQ